MAFASSIATSLVVEVKDKTHPVFKKHLTTPWKMTQLEHFPSFHTKSVLHVDDVQAYIHYEIEETGSKDILDLLTDKSMDDIGSPMPKFAQLKKKGFT